VPAAPLYTVAEAVADAQVVHLQLLEDVEHPVSGRWRLVGPPVRYQGAPRQANLPPPLVGEHSTAILRELGRSESAIRELQEREVVRARR
jgi:crotonobetainyl-CoA:carnitine CoA-transferase CaiB-like acyl-CoA transferase